MPNFPNFVFFIFHLAQTSLLLVLVGELGSSILRKHQWWASWKAQVSSSSSCLLSISPYTPHLRPPKTDSDINYPGFTRCEGGVIHQCMGSTSKLYITPLVLPFKDTPWEWNSVNATLSVGCLLRQLYSTLHFSAWWSERYCLTFI